MIGSVGYGARGRREAIRQLSELRRRLVAAQDALAGAQATAQRAETAFEAASEDFAEAEGALDAARERRAHMRRERYAARQARERAAAIVARLEGRVRELSDRAGQPPTLTTHHVSLTSNIFNFRSSCVLIRAWNR
jgi:uncharacterized protein (DUF3084 family)